MSEEKRVFVVLDDRLDKSIARDFVSCGTLLGAVAIGWFLGSIALQWVGAIIWFLWFFARMFRDTKNNTYGTIADARAALDKIEEGQ